MGWAFVVIVVRFAAGESGTGPGSERTSSAPSAQYVHWFQDRGGRRERVVGVDDEIDAGLDSSDTIEVPFEMAKFVTFW